MAIKITINDVAKEAGVSITTVSRVMNGNYPVKKETKEKVIAVIEKLNYKPNDIAVSMVRKKTNMIGVIIPSITNMFFSTLVKGINDVLYRENYTMIMLQSNGNEKELVEKLLARQVDGIIVFDSDISKNNKYYKKVSKIYPLIFLNTFDESFSTVSSNQEQGTILALEYLKKLKHEKILLVRGIEDGYSYNLKEEIYSTLVEDGTILYVENSNKDDAIKNTKDVVKKFYKHNKDYSSIFCSNDLMAIGAIEGLKELKLKVPKDISVVGFDNIFLTELVTPKITTIDQNSYELGRLSAENIIKKTINNGKINIKIKSKLIERESCNNFF